MKYLISLYILLLATFVSAQHSFLNEITSIEHFELLSANEFNEGTSSYEKTILVAYSVQDDKAYFINTGKYELHFYFCKEELGYKNDHALFNRKEYSSLYKRSYVNYKLVYHSFSDYFTIENYVGEEISSGLLAKGYRRVCELIDIEKPCYYLPTSNVLTKLSEKEGLNILPLSSVLNGKSFKALNSGVGQGVLKVIGEGKYTWKEVNPEDIILLTEPNNDLPPNAGIITTFYQPYLSHINVLSRQREVPNMMYTEALMDSLILNLEGKYVELKVLKGTFDIREIKEVSISDSIKKIVLTPDDSFNEIVPIRKVKFSDTKSIGRKASNLAELRKVEWVRIPEGAFVIPFSYYLRHIKKSGASELIKRINNGGMAQEIVLDSLRSLIINTSLDTLFLNKVKEFCEGKPYDFRFRSSSNCEDLKGFNGAGLYKSVTGSLSRSDKSIERAIKKVWASLWTYRAYYERKHINIDQESVRMGVLVHRSFPNENASGIALTHNPFSELKTGIYMSVSPGNYRVANPSDTVDRVSEALIYSDFIPGQIRDVRLLKGLNQSEEESVLKYMNFQRFHDAMVSIRSRFISLYDDPLMNFEVEFKIDAGKLYFKQVRPY